MAAVELAECNVCGLRQAIGVAAVPGIPVSCAYCRECLEANAHPIGLLIANTAMCGGLHLTADWWQHMVGCTLHHLGRTLEWFETQVLEEMLNLEGEDD